MSQGLFHIHVGDGKNIARLSCRLYNSVALLLCSHHGLSPFLQEGPGEPEGDETVAGYVSLCTQRAEGQSAADGS